MASTPPSPSQINDGHSEHYYFAVATAAVLVLLVVYNMIAIGCFAPRSASGSIRRLSQSRRIRDELIQKEIPVCKYWKEKEKEQECSVCLSDFVDGEEIRQLPDCKHSFHPPCIGMWLYSHSNCPLCRATVVVPTQLRRELAAAAATAADDDAESGEGQHLSTSRMAGLIVVIL